MVRSIQAQLCSNAGEWAMPNAQFAKVNAPKLFRMTGFEDIYDKLCTVAGASVDLVEPAMALQMLAGRSGSALIGNGMVYRY